MKTIASASKPFLALFLCGFGALAITAYAQTTNSAAEQEIIKLENAYNDAWQNNDSAFLQKLFADEYLATNSDGTTSTKAQDLALAKSGEFKTESARLDDMKVHIYGDTAVVTGQNTLKATDKGKDASGPRRFTDVFVKRDGRWQVVATQYTLAPKR